MLANAAALKLSLPPHYHFESISFPPNSAMERNSDSSNGVTKEALPQNTIGEASLPSLNVSSAATAAASNPSSNDNSKAAQLESIRLMQQYLKSSRRNSVDGLAISSPPSTSTASLLDTANTRNSTMDSSLFATAELLKQHLMSDHTDDPLLQQILFSTLDRSKSASSSSDAKESAESFRTKSITSDADSELTVDEVIAKKKSYLDGLLQQIARNSSSGGVDANLFSSTAWKPLLQPNHQDIDYSANIFASSFAAAPVEALHYPSTTMATSEIANANALILPPATCAAETLLIAAELAEVATNAVASDSKSIRTSTENNSPRNWNKNNDDASNGEASDVARAASLTDRNEVSVSAQDVILIEDSEITNNDVLLGRGGRTNHHEGNKKYLQYKLLLQDKYFRANKEGKTKISSQLVQMVHDQKGRFLKQADPLLIRRLLGAASHSMNGDDSQLWHEVDVITARKKASQTLREQSTPEFRAAKRAKYSR